MAIHKVIEVLSQSERAGDAAQRAVKDAAKSVRHVSDTDADGTARAHAADQGAAVPDT